ncbi:MAG: MarR family transcriptional regulator [Oscillospiraceae bacterium]|nr:MarR family transcriptional regulator [Oscillospiraceae bacterium]
MEIENAASNTLNEEINEVLVNTFHLILKTELKMIKECEKNDLSMREIHLLEIVGKAENGIGVSQIANIFQITVASVTMMVKKMEQRQLIERQKDSTDGRSVLLRLTEAGKKIDAYHYQFHQTMVEHITGRLTDFEKQVFLGSIKKLNEFFNMELL